MANVDRILIVRLGSLGDIVHTLPLAAALRRGFPSARIDWVVDERHHEFLDLVSVVDRCIVWRTRSVSAWRSIGGVVTELRREHYDVVLDSQGLLKSAVLARMAGGRRVIGFPRTHLREPAARFFYDEECSPGTTRHVVELNLSLASLLGVERGPWEFPLEVRDTIACTDVQRRLGLENGQYAVLNPGAAWPNKRWPPEWFGAIARRLRMKHGLPVAVIWGPGEELLAESVAVASDGAAIPTGSTSLADLVAVLKRATLLVSGDTGPLHIAAALGTPIVGIYGPTNPDRNGPWAPADHTVSRFAECRCHHRRSCRVTRWCVGNIAVDAVAEAVDERLSAIS